MKRPLRSLKTDIFVPANELPRYVDAWLLDGRYRQLSEETITNRRNITSKFLWWIRTNGVERCDAQEIKRFLSYFTTAHLDPKGRWGNRRMREGVRPRTVKDYHATLRTFFRWLVEDGCIDESPMEGIRPPLSRPDQVQPFTQEQIDALLFAARSSRHPTRDEAVLLFLLDTGVRSSELCTLQLADVDIPGKRAVVLGKGNKRRTVYFSHVTAKALRRYLKDRREAAGSHLFVSERSERYSRSGLQQMIERLAKHAGIEAARCSPHTFRHTAAIWFLRNGGQVFALKEMLGHTDLTMTMRYVAIAQADVQDQHRQFSPVLRLNKGR